MFKKVLFEDRKEAGKMLAAKLQKFSDREVMVLAIPRGGVVVGYEIAKKIHSPLDIIVPRKLRAPNQPELAIGAITEDGNIMLEEQIVNSLNVSNDYVIIESQRQKLEIDRRLRAYKGEKKIPDLTGLHVIVVDDGLASGFSMLVTVKTLRAKAGEVVVAVPTAPVNAIELIRAYVDKVVCLNIRSDSFFAVADAYRVWYDLTDRDVIEFLRQNKN